MKDLTKGSNAIYNFLLQLQTWYLHILTSPPNLSKFWTADFAVSIPFFLQVRPGVYTLATSRSAPFNVELCDTSAAYMTGGDSSAAYRNGSDSSAAYMIANDSSAMHYCTEACATRDGVCRSSASYRDAANSAPSGRNCQQSSTHRLNRTKTKR
jgi:hypothetical protein